MRSLFKAVSLAALLLFSPSAWANESGGHITSYIPQVGGLLFFTSDGQRDNVPACSVQPRRWVIDGSTAGGQVLVAGLLTAYAQHKNVTLIGTGNCNVWSDTESIAYFYVF